MKLFVMLFFKYTKPHYSCAQNMEKAFVTAADLWYEPFAISKGTEVHGTRSRMLDTFERVWH